MPRLFVAIDLPDQTKERLQSICCGLQGARWVRDGQFHVTLRFIGDVEGPRFRAISEALESVRADPFELQVQGVGHFPPRGNPKIAWAGLSPCPELAVLHKSVERALRHAGVEPDRRKFAPHVTLARLKGTALPQMVEFLAQYSGLRCEVFPVLGFELYSSVLYSSGALHTVEASYPLFPSRA